MRPNPSAAERQIVRDYARRTGLRQQLRAALARQLRLARHLKQLSRRYDEARWVTEIYRGVPLKLSRETEALFGCGGNRRLASYFRNVKAPGHWGLEISEGIGYRHACGSDWPSRKAVLAAAHEWVACGCVPLTNGIGIIRDGAAT